MKKKFYTTHVFKISSSNHDVDIEVSDEVDEAIKDLMSQSIVLFNDDHNTFDHVISCLVDFCDHHPHQAEQCAMIVHHNGKCEVKRGSFDDLKPICEALLENGLSAKIQ